MSQQLVDAIQRVGATFEEFKKYNDRRLDELNARLDAREKTEAELDRPGGAPKFTSEQNEHKNLMLAWVRNPTDPRAITQLSEAQHELAKKDVSIGTPSAGGFALPKEIETRIEARARLLNPFRTLIDVAPAGSSDIHALVDMSDNTVDWSSETGTRNSQTTPTLRDRQPTGGELYALLSTTNWSLQDLFFDVEQWLVDDTSKGMAVAEANAIVTGNGTNRPTGFTNTTAATIDAASPMRAASAIEKIVLANSPISVKIDDLITLKGRVADEYRIEADRCAFVMRSSTWDVISKQKASTAGTYHVDPLAPPPESILGFPLKLTDAMPTGYPVAFGNFRRGYFLRDRGAMQIIMDKVTTPGFTRFYIARRVYGAVRDNDAIKVLSTS